MNANIVGTIDNQYQQLLEIGVDLSHKIVGLMDCSPELISNVHAMKAFELAKQYNKISIDIYLRMFSKEGK